jgi:hypothetical protein
MPRAGERREVYIPYSWAVVCSPLLHNGTCGSFFSLKSAAVRKHVLPIGLLSPGIKIPIGAFHVGAGFAPECILLESNVRRFGLLCWNQDLLRTDYVS